MIWAGETSTNAGRCLPSSNWATYRDGEENLEKLLNLLGKTTANQASNYHANHYPVKSRLLEQAHVEHYAFPTIQITNEPDTAESTEHRTKRNHSHCGCPKFALFGLRFFPALILFVWLLAHVGQTLPHTGTAGENLGAKGTPCGGRLRGSGGCCYFLETA